MNTFPFMLGPCERLLNGGAEMHCVIVCARTCQCLRDKRKNEAKFSKAHNRKPRVSYVAVVAGARKPMMMESPRRRGSQDLVAVAAGFKPCLWLVSLPSPEKHKMSTLAQEQEDGLELRAWCWLGIFMPLRVVLNWNWQLGSGIVSKCRCEKRGFTLPSFLRPKNNKWYNSIFWSHRVPTGP